MKAAKEVGHRRQPVRCGHPATLPPHGRSAPATRRDSGGAEARAPIRRRRAHSHRPGLCSDKWGASCPDVWSRGRRASPRQRGSCLGRRRSDVVPGPTKPVQPLSTPQRGASSRTCHRPQRPRNPPPQSRRASDRASGARASAAVGAMSFLVLRSRSSRCQRLGVERPPVHATARNDPATLPPQSRRASDPLRRLARPRRSPCLEKTLIASPICGRSGQLHFSAKKIR